MDLFIDSISKSYGGKKVIDEVSFRFKPGIYALLGPNGAGKSTLMRMLCNVEKPDQGSIRLDGTDIQVLKNKYYAKLGYLPQDWGYYPQFSVKDFLNYFSVLKGLPSSYSRKEIKNLLEMFGLEKMYRKKIKTLSGGMIQRVGIVQALLGRPEILVLDEPTAGLDPKERMNFRNILNDYGKDRIILLSTHIVSDIEVLANEILILNEGRLIRHGCRKELVRELQGKVWEYHLESGQSVSKEFPVISTRYDNEYLIVRVLSENRPYENAWKADVTLEDIYYYCFSKKLSENNIL